MQTCNLSCITLKCDHPSPRGSLSQISKFKIQLIGTPMTTTSKTVLISTLAITIGLTMMDSVTKVASAEFVDVPSNYVYDTSGRSGPVARHDYCTSSPDEFPTPIGSNADFRGPCARHDLCYDSSTDKKVCDASLFANMLKNCANEYGFFNPYRAACFNTANLYFTAVVAAQ